MATDRGRLQALVAFLAFLASAVFFGLGVFDVSVGDVNLILAGLFCMAIGAVVDHVP